MKRQDAAWWTPGWVIACLLLAVHSQAFGFITDDAYISFVFSRNLAEHGQLVFNLGDPVEGYTNFLWTFILGILHYFGWAAEDSAHWLAFAFAAATLAVVGRFVLVALAPYPAVVRRGASWLVMLALPINAGFACWTSGGLETQMFTFFVVAGCLSYCRRLHAPGPLWPAAALLALSAMTRPEGLLITGIIGLHLFIRNMCSQRTTLLHKPELFAGVIFLAIWLPWFIWRWSYYGEIAPNTFYVKAAGETSRSYQVAMRNAGLFYVWQWVNYSGFLYAGTFVLIGLLQKSTALWRTAASLIALVAVTYIIYTIRVGGDFMGLHRFLMPVTVLLILAGAIGGIGLVVWLTRGFKPGVIALDSSRGAQCIFLVVIAQLIGAYGYHQHLISKHARTFVGAENGIDTPAYLKQYADDRAAIGKAMAPCFDDADFSIFGGVGAKPYYAKARGVDIFGLVSKEIAHNVRPSRPRPGHNKWGPPRLMLKTYDPTFVFHCYKIHKGAKTPRRLCGEEGFWRRHGYDLGTVKVDGLSRGMTHYSFLKKKERNLVCPAAVRPT